MTFMKRSLTLAKRNLARNVKSLAGARRDLKLALAEITDAQRCLQHATTSYVREQLRIIVNDTKDEMLDAKDEIAGLLTDIRENESEIKEIVAEMKS